MIVPGTLIIDEEYVHLPCTYLVTSATERQWYGSTLVDVECLSIDREGKIKIDWIQLHGDESKGYRRGFIVPIIVNVSQTQ